jgi:hypothetical protein
MMILKVLNQLQKHHKRWFPYHNEVDAATASSRLENFSYGNDEETLSRAERKKAKIQLQVS